MLYCNKEVKDFLALYEKIGIFFSIIDGGDVFVLFENFRTSAHTRKTYGIANFLDGKFGSDKQLFGFIDTNLC